jgi:hypothetical protein
MRRKRSLGRLIWATSTVLSQMFSIEDRRRDLFATAERLDLEGIVAKRTADPYAAGTVWYKVKNRVYTQAAWARVPPGLAWKDLASRPTGCACPIAVRRAPPAFPGGPGWRRRGRYWPSRRTCWISGARLRQSPPNLDESPRARSCLRAGPTAHRNLADRILATAPRIRKATWHS